MIAAARRLSYAGSVDGWGAKTFVRVVEWTTATPRLLWRLRAIAGDPPSGGIDLNRAILRALDIGVDLQGAAVPPDGPLLIAATHPHGVADGMAVLEAVCQVRRDVRVLASALVPDMDVILPVPYGHVAGRRAALGKLRVSMHDHLAEGGVVIAFPAGRISLPRQEEAPWAPFVFRTAHAAGARVMPLHVAGGNSALFGLAARAGPVLRQSLLLRELARLSGRTIRLTAGPPRPVLGRGDATGLRAEAIRLGTTAASRG